MPRVGAIADATVGFDLSGLALVSIRFEPEAAARFAEVSGAHVGHRLAIVLDDEAVSAPVVREAITGGVAQIDMGTADPDPDAALAEAQALVAALGTEPLQAAWRVVE